MCSRFHLFVGDFGIRSNSQVNPAFKDIIRLVKPTSFNRRLLLWEDVKPRCQTPAGFDCFVNQIPIKILTMHWRKICIFDIHQTDFPVLNLSEVLKQLPTLKLAWLTWFQALVGNCITLSFSFFQPVGFNQEDNLDIWPQWAQEKGKLGKWQDQFPVI